MSIQGAELVFQDGSLIFKQGDPGGDLYFIKEGEVEVFRMENGLEVSLATLNAGEVLGIMTCLTRDPRLASARARGTMRAIVVKQAGIRTLISSTPPWVHTVIKDFILRIKQMDELYARSMSRLEHREREASVLSLAITYAHGLRELGALLTPGETLDRIVDIDFVQKRFARVIGVAEHELTRIFDAFVQSGLIKVDPKSTARRAEYGVLDRLSGFALFARDMRGWDALSPNDHAALVAANEKTRGHTEEMVFDNPDAALRQAATTIANSGVLRFDASGAKITIVPLRLSNALKYYAAVLKLRELTPAPTDEAGAIQILSENF